MRRDCAFAFVNVEGLHHTPGWTQVPFTLFGTTDLPRSAHAIKVPLCLQRPVVYADLKLVERVSVDPFACAEPLRSAQRHAEGEPDADVDVAVARHPGFDWRTLEAEFRATRLLMARRNMSGAVMSDIDRQEERLRRAGFSMTSVAKLPDTFFIAWSPTRAARAFASRWLHEIARYSMREQLNFNYAASLVPGLRVRFVPTDFAWTCSRAECVDRVTWRSPTGGEVSVCKTT